jgi:hypothetical protein
MKNISDHEVDCGGAPSNGLDRRYAYDVVGPDGQPAPKVVRNHPEIGETGSIWRCVIKPGETATAAGGRISQLYDFSRPGKYSIQVRRHAAFDARSDVIKSNTLVITVVPAEEQTKAAAPTFSLTLSAPKTEVALGGDVWIKIQQTNLSDQTISCSAHVGNGVNYGFGYEVRDQHGAVVAKVVRPHPELSASYNFRPCDLRPSQSKTANTLLSRLYEFDQPGEYTIQVSRPDAGNSKGGDVKSNTITISVLPEGEQPSAKPQAASH